MRPATACVFAALFVLQSGCARSTPDGHATGGDAERGAALIRALGCGACHDVPGIRGSRGVIGPPLDAFARRGFIAGRLPNTPANLVRWLEDPPAVDPQTAMPALDMTAADARDVAAYLYTLD